MTGKLHPLHTDIPRPERFTYPFCYEPHPLAVMAAEEVQRHLGSMTLTEGKMFGVLVVAGGTPTNYPPPTGGVRGGFFFLAAYSGLLEGRNDWEYFVPPVFDAQQPDGHFKQTERRISQLSQQSPIVARKMSQELQLWLFHQYQFLNARGERRDLVDVWQDYHCSPRIRRKFPLPPGGTGDCCAPKLLQYAYRQGLEPVCMAEFWWGPSPKSEVRHHGRFYPACRGKCKPVLTWMLQGLDVDPSPDEDGFPHLKPEVVYEDEALAVVNKPSGMLSIPGRTENYSVATWAKRQWAGAMPVHRLDMWTSGIILVAKTKEAFLGLQQQFEQRTVKKKYLAIVEGTPAEEHGIIDLPLLCDPLNRPRQVVDYERGKRAITEYRVLRPPLTPPVGGEQNADKLLGSICPSSTGGAREGLTLLALWPHTGRTHQLRMHCAHKDGLGCPILGDELYGHRSDRLYLEASAITFVHPVTERRMHFELPYPFDNILPYNNK